MRSRVIIGAIGAILALAGSSIAVGSTAERRVAAPPAAHAAQQLPKSLTKVQRAVTETARARVRCGSIQCRQRGPHRTGKGVPQPERMHVVHQRRSLSGLPLFE